MKNSFKFVNMPLEQLQTLDRDALLVAWQESNTELQSIKKREWDLRALVISKCFPDAVEGMNRLELGNGYLLKFENKKNYFLANTPEMEKAINKLPDHVSERLVKWKPEIMPGELKKLDVESREYKIIAPFVTEKPAAPSLKILAPGDEGNKR